MQNTLVGVPKSLSGLFDRLKFTQVSPIHRTLSLLLLGLYLYSAIVGETFFHPDEHFQIIEVGHYKLGTISNRWLPWEFHRNLRPMFQPFCFFVLIKTANFFGIFSPFLISLLFRIFTAVLYWAANMAILRMIPLVVRDEKVQKLTLLWGTILWFLPWLGVRPSSEAWAGAFFFLGWAKLSSSLLDKSGEKIAWSVGAFVGLMFLFSFQARYQLTFAIAGMGLWSLIFHGKRAFPTVAIMTSVFFLGLLVFLAIDTWGYGKFTFAPWKYFEVNAIEGVPAKVFGVQEWYYYLKMLLVDSLPFSLLYLVAFHFVWCWDFKSPLTWATLSFYLGHLAFGHKEYRFMFPMALAVPLVSGRFIELVMERRPNWVGYFDKKFFHRFYAFAFWVNAVQLFLMPHVVVRREIDLYKHLYARSVRNIYFAGGSPFGWAWYLPQPFIQYSLPPGPTIPENVIREADGSWYAVLSGPGLEEKEAKLYSGCRPVVITLPLWFSGKQFETVRRKTKVIDYRLYQCRELDQKT